MGAGVRVTRGAENLERLLREQTWDFRGLDLTGFRAWLDRLLVRWEQDPVFRQRSVIRALRRSHPELRQLERTHRAATAVDAASPSSARLREVERAAADVAKAVAGLTAALAAAAPDRRDGLSTKLDAFRARLRDLESERAALTQTATERQALLRAESLLQCVRSATGLAAEETRLTDLLTARGRRAGRVGDTFEDDVAAAVVRDIVPELATGRDVRLLRRVRLGAAGIEFDALVARVPDAGGVAEVLAAVEAKRDVNGVAHGFLRRQADLAWLTGEAGAYDPAVFRTRAFPTGHFDRAAGHTDVGSIVRFGPGSFAGFRRDIGAGWFLDRLYLATRAGPLWGLSPAALARVSSWVATDEDFDPNDPNDLADLQRRCRVLAGPVEAPDVLRTFASNPDRARQVLLVEANSPRDGSGQPPPSV